MGSLELGSAHLSCKGEPLVSERCCGNVSETVCPIRGPADWMWVFAPVETKQGTQNWSSVQGGLGENESIFIFCAGCTWLILWGSRTSNSCLLGTWWPRLGRLLQGNTWKGRQDRKWPPHICSDVLCLCRKEKLMPWAWMEASSILRASVDWCLSWQRITVSGRDAPQCCISSRPWKKEMGKS